MKAGNRVYISALLKELTPAKALLFLGIVALAANLDTLVDALLNPEIPYLNAEHLIMGSVNIALVTITLVITGSYNVQQKILHEKHNEELESRLTAQRAELVAAGLNLKESEQKYISLLETTDTGYVIIDEGGKVVDANLIYVHLAGYNDFEEIRGRSVLEWTAPWERDKNAQGVAQCARDGFIRNFEIEYIDPNGHVTPIEVNATLVGKDSNTQILTLCRDISERKHYETALRNAASLAEAANRAKSEFLANMSHELHTPLNSIIGFSDVLRDGLGGPLSEKQESYVDNIRMSGRHLYGMIKDMLDFAQMEAGTMELRITPFHLRDILTGAISRFMEKAASRGISISLEMAPEVESELRSDPSKLKQILYCLLSNAVKFTPEGGSVQVSARRVSDCRGAILAPYPADQSDQGVCNTPLQHRDFIEIAVEDTGIGIREEDKAKIFEGLTQLESPYTKRYGGAGLGLALTKQLVERLGGVIRVESEVGRGSRFIVAIPAEIGEEEGAS